MITVGPTYTSKKLSKIKLHAGATNAIGGNSSAIHDPACSDRAVFESHMTKSDFEV